MRPPNRFLATLLPAVMLLLAACEPQDRRPGLWLSGELVDPPPEDFSFVLDYPEIFVETRPWYGIPFSVTTVIGIRDGKLYVPSDVLNYSGALTESERKLVKTHPTVGYEILKHIDLPWPVADIVHQHHERIDGSGYPNNLKGDEILFGAKILAVADVVESMFSDRPFRRGFNEVACLAEIEENRGVLYENDVVDACLKIIRDGRYKLKKQR